jgi:polysaccharide biosynthesis/export protein
MAKSLTACAAAAVVAATSVGCESKSYWDPGEVGRYEKTPLVVPILDRLTVGLDEGELDFSQAREPRPQDMVVSSDDYKLGANDLIQVDVTDLVGPGIQSTQTRRVTESGTVSMPNLNKPVVVSGLTEFDAEQAIKKAYLDAQILADASTVSVTVVEARNRTFRIGGAIPTPGQYLIEKNDYRLYDALLQAGQAQTVGSDYVFIVRKKQTAAAAPTDSAPAVDPMPGTTPGADPLLPSSSRKQTRPVASASFMQGSVILASNVSVSNLETSGEFMANQPMDVAPATTPAELPGATEGRAVQIEGAPTEPAMTEPAMTPVPMPDLPGSKPMSDAVPFAGPADSSDASDAFDGFEALEDPSGREVIRVELLPLLKNMKNNLVVRPDDFIIVQNLEVGEYFMGGHVQRTGVYSMTGRKITLKQAIVSAGMFDQVAVPARTDIIRRVGPNQEVFVRVDLEKIFTGLEPDIFMKPNDTVMVGTNAGAPFLAAFRNAFRVTYGFGFLYDRNFFGTDNVGNNFGRW